MTSRSEPTVIEFDANHPAALVRAVEGLLGSRDGWVNVQAVTTEDIADAARARAGIFGWFSSKGPGVPVSTWVPGELDRRGGIDPDEIGIQHPGGPRALAKLRDQGVPPPDGWRQLADHPKRGLVLQSTHPTTPTDVEPMVTWLILASRLLATDPLPDDWAAVVHRR